MALGEVLGLAVVYHGFRGGGYWVLPFYIIALGGGNPGIWSLYIMALGVCVCGGGSWVLPLYIMALGEGGGPGSCRCIVWL